MGGGYRLRRSSIRPPRPTPINVTASLAGVLEETLISLIDDGSDVLVLHAFKVTTSPPLLEKLANILRLDEGRGHEAIIDHHG